jgi:hypothetical protein
MKKAEDVGDITPVFLLLVALSTTSKKPSPNIMLLEDS